MAVTAGDVAVATGHVTIAVGDVTIAVGNAAVAVEDVAVAVGDAAVAVEQQRPFHNCDAVGSWAFRRAVTGGCLLTTLKENLDMRQVAQHVKANIFSQSD